jgi:hypothetical protein
MLERDEISAVRVAEPLIPRRDVARTEGTPAMARKQESFSREGLSTVVVDVQGPIVTGVLGGD